MGRAMKIPQFQTVHDLYNQEKLTWIELMKGNSEAGSLLAAFDLYLVICWFSENLKRLLISLLMPL